MNQLQILDLSYNHSVDDNFIKSLVGSNNKIAINNYQRSLKKLTLRLCTQITGSSLKAILTNLNNLECLDISGCTSVDLSALVNVRQSQRLIWLCLELLSVRREHLNHLAAFSRIERLSLKSCLDLQDHDVEPLRDLQTLKMLNLFNCQNLSMTLISELKESSSARE